MLKSKGARSAARVAAVVLGGVALTAPMFVPAAAAPPVASWGSGKYVRVTAYDNLYRTGNTLSILGSNACTPTYSDVDTTFSNLDNRGWGTAIASAKDFVQCDVNLFEGDNYGGDFTGYINYGNGKNVPGGWNNRADSLQVS